MRIHLLFILVLLSLSCSNEHKELEIIDIASAFQNQQAIKLSKFVDNITYVPLESKTESFISDHPTIKVEDYIIVRNTGFSVTPLMIFDKSNGKFIRYIGKIGRGPGEYSAPTRDFYNSQGKCVYTMDYSHREIRVLDINGNYLENFRTPEVSEPSVKGGKLVTSFDTYINNETYVSYINNFTGVIKTKLVLFNKDTILKIYPNYLRWGDHNEAKNRIPSFSPQFWKWDNNLYFKEVFNDTLFNVSLDALIPIYKLNSGVYGLTYEHQDRISPSFGQLSNDYFLVTDIDENSHFIFLRLFYQKKEYICIYDKRLKNTCICKPVDNYQSALLDDINDFIPIIPKDITRGNEMVSVLAPKDIIQWIIDNPEKSQHLKKEFDWLNTVSETSNPVIVIAKFKE